MTATSVGAASSPKHEVFMNSDFIEGAGGVSVSNHIMATCAGCLVTSSSAEMQIPSGSPYVFSFLPMLVGFAGLLLMLLLFTYLFFLSTSQLLLFITESVLTIFYTMQKSLSV